jgi:glycosyltransferase involved in cell wall biosynthesis
VIVAARNEADRVGATVNAVKEAFPQARVWVADDASDDETQAVAIAHGAQVVSRGRPHGKGGNVTAAAEAALGDEPVPELVLLCDADLAGSAVELPALVAAVEDGSCDLAVAAFANRVGGGFGIALGFARWAIERRSGYRAQAAISGQRAMRTELLGDLLPFAAGYGMEIGMTIDAVRGGHRVREIELDLAHRATGRAPRDFLHRGRQLLDFVRVWWSRRKPG